MGDEREKGYSWQTVLVGRLCLIGWISVILYECFPFVPWMRQLFLAAGPWICLLAFFHALVYFFRYKQGIFLIFMLVATPPTIHFGMVLRNIAFDQGSNSTATPPRSEKPADSSETKPERKTTGPAEQDNLDTAQRRDEAPVGRRR